MFVRQLVGRLAGELVEMPYAAARGCLDAGTVRLPEAEPQARAVVAEPQAADPARLALSDAPPSMKGRRKRG